VVKLTKRQIDALPIREKDYFEWDDELSGLGIRVWPTGKKVYLVRYRQSGRQRFFKLGNHGALTPEQARREARIKLGEVAAGDDPQEERTTRRKSITVAELCDDYLAAADKGLILGKGGRPKKASTLATDRGRIEQHIKPLLGRKLVVDVTRADVAGFVRDVISGKTAKTEKSGNLRGVTKVTGGPGTGARTKGLLGGIFSYAVEHGIIETNPASGVRAPAGRQRTRRFSDGELKALGKVLRDADDQYWQTIAFTRLALLTGWRKSEIEGLRWDQLDLERSTVVFEDSKEGRSVRPLGAAVVELLKSLDGLGRYRQNRQNLPQYVLPTLRKGDHYAGGYRAFLRLCERAEITDVSPHTARHTIVSKGQEELGYSESLCGAVVGHRKSLTVTGGYTHFAPTFLIEVASAMSGAVAGLLDGSGGEAN